MSDRTNKRKISEEPLDNNLSKKKLHEGDSSDDDDNNLPEESGDSSDLSANDFDEDDEEGGDDEEGEEDEDDEEDDNDEFLDKEITIDFVADPTDEADFDGIKCLLQRLWLKENVNSSDLANLLIEENKIALILRQDYDEEEDQGEEDKNDIDQVYGIVSLVPINTKFTAKESVAQIKALLLSRIPKNNLIHEKLQDSKSVCGFVINERFLNLPPKISVPCYENLASDLTSLIAENEKDYNFDWVIMMCKVVKDKNTKNKNTIYMNAEDELFSDSAETFFEYSVADQCDGDVFDWEDDENLYEPFRKVLLLTKAKWLETVAELKDNL